MGKVWSRQVYKHNFYRDVENDFWILVLRSYCEVFVYYWPPLPIQNCFSSPSLENYEQLALASADIGNSVSSGGQQEDALTYLNRGVDNLKDKVKKVLTKFEKIPQEEFCFAAGALDPSLTG